MNPQMSAENIRPRSKFFMKIKLRRKKKKIFKHLSGMHTKSSYKISVLCLTIQQNVLGVGLDNRKRDACAPVKFLYVCAFEMIETSIVQIN